MKKISTILCIILIILSIYSIILPATRNITQSRENQSWWPMFRHDPQHTGYSSVHAPNTNNKIWDFKMFGYGGCSPTVNDDKIFVGSDNYVICINAQTRQIHWYMSTGGTIYSSPAVFNSKVYVGSYDNKVYCLDAETGNINWSYTTENSIFASPTVTEDRLFIGSFDHNIYCLDADPYDDGIDEGIQDPPDVDYDLIWIYTTGDSILSSPAVVNNRVYVGSEDNKIYCLDMLTGENIWTYTTYGDVSSSPTVVDNKTYLSSHDGKVYCLNAENGSLIWRYNMKGGLGFVDAVSSPAIAYGRVYIGSGFYSTASGLFGGYLHCLNAENGSRFWSYPTEDYVRSSPAVADGKVYFASWDGRLYCLNATEGIPIWEYGIGATTASPAIANGSLYIISDYGYLFYLRDNQRPTIPTTPSGPTTVVVGVDYNFSTSAIDPDGDQLYYGWRWEGEQLPWQGPYASGQTINFNHTWENEGIYEVRVTAKDTKNSISHASEPLVVTVISAYTSEKEKSCRIQKADSIRKQQKDHPLATEQQNTSANCNFNDGAYINDTVEITTDPPEDEWLSFHQSSTIHGYNTLLNGNMSRSFDNKSILVKFKKGIDVSTSTKALQQVRNIINVDSSFVSIESAEPLLSKTQQKNIGKGSDLTCWVKIAFQETTDILRELEKYNSNPSIDCVEPNYKITPCIRPNDSHFHNQWGLDQSNDCDIDAKNAWDIETGSSEVIIAIVDSGISYTHSDLRDKIWVNPGEDLNGNGVVDPEDFDDEDNDNNGFIDDLRGWDFVNNDNDPSDDVGHGTACAGVAAAATNNSEGIAGVSWYSPIMIVKALGPGGGYVEDAVNAINYAVSNNASVISMSWGMYDDSELLKDALEYAYQNNVVLVAGAGNNNLDNEFYPAAYDIVIGVAATDGIDVKLLSSNYGPWVDIAAPGIDIWTTYPSNTYGPFHETSAACPFAAGSAALLLSKNQGSHPQEMVKTILADTADGINSIFSIGGRLNAHKALQRQPAALRIEPVVNWTNIKDIIDICGTAWGESFQYYTVDYGRGAEPDGWTEVVNSTEMVQHDVLASIDTTEMPEGLYTVRLQVFCEDGYYQDTEQIVVNNIQNTLEVDDDPGGIYNCIQDAVDDAGNGDIVFVHEGVYKENIFINRMITLSGEDLNTTTIRAQYSNAIKVTADHVGISGFTIKSNGGSGIFILESSRCTITKNRIQESSGGVVLVSTANYNHIVNNSIKHNSVAVNLNDNCDYNYISHNIMINNDDGMKIQNCYYNNFSRNIVKHQFLQSIEMVGYEKYNTFYMNDIAFSIRGIYLRGTSDANIYGNDFSYNDYGIKFLASSNNSILENSFFENNVGIDIWESSSIDNQIYHNNFINNSCNAQNIGDNNWDNGYPSGGNYWHDYNGTDENEDGIGDTPYNITGGDNQDHYPYMNPNGWKEENKPPIVEIINPIEGYFHLSGIPLLPTRFNLIADTMSLGGFRLRPIRINVTDDMDASEDLLVKIYLDGEERGNAAWNSEVGYHEWKWTGWALGTYTLNITAEDTGSEIGNAEIEVCNFCFLP